MRDADAGRRHADDAADGRGRARELALPFLFLSFLFPIPIGLLSGRRVQPAVVGFGRSLPCSCVGESGIFVALWIMDVWK